MSSTTRRARFALQSLRARVGGRRLAHFVHVGKTAGTALKTALRDAPEPAHYHVVSHTHGVRMMDLPRSDAFFFVVRDPVDRFVSGFNSRLRQGRPRFNEPWTEAEARAFAEFSTPAALATALAGTGPGRERAIDAMRSIEHVRTSYWDWFGSPAALRRRERRILWIGFVDSLDEQVPELARRLGLDAIELPVDEAAAHRSSNDLDRSLPPEAREVLAAWYRRDYEFVELCRELAPRG